MYLRPGVHAAVLLVNPNSERQMEISADMRVVETTGMCGSNVVVGVVDEIAPGTPLKLKIHAGTILIHFGQSEDFGTLEG
ncbi:hypothetical protein N7456_003663 [Penicillium angulare]|uniref:Uncharacterized protein n=1 Tax=Penicillium angulare TaxID=116970 RepID=A0A9W9FV68_9EURO|nr:hypothetical protein N7456_003663 [Penicillium angulare]